MKKICLFILLAIMSPVTAFADFFVTVYNQNLGLVKEQREVELKSGETSFRFEDVPSKIDETSVHLKSITYPGNVAILEQNYQYDLVSERKLMSKYIGKELKVNLTENRTQQGKLLTISDNIVLMDENGKVNIINWDSVRDITFPKLPEGLILKPSLFWLLDVNRGGKQKVEISYLTEGLNWEAKYVAVVNQDDTRLSVDGLVILNNNCGMTFTNTKLKLVAGEIHRVREERRRPTLEFAAAKGRGAEFEEEAFFEYHLYTLQRPTTLKDNETKEITLFPTAEVNTDKIYTYEPTRSDNVKVELEFKNSSQAGLGIPLPKGIVRVYKEDSEGMLQFVGEDKIDHTPKDEKVRVYLGNAFDIVGERTVTAHRKISDRTTQETISIKLRNHKDEDCEIVVVEHPYGDWIVTSSNYDYQKESSRKLVFKIPVPKDEEVELVYTVRMSW